jgi:hypothetical protein
MSSQDLTITVSTLPVIGAATIPTFEPTTTFSPTASNYLIVTAFNAGSATLKGVGLWVTFSTWVGEIEVRDPHAPETDYLDIVKFGDQALEDGGPQQITQGATLPVDYTPGGIWVRPSPGTTWYRVTSLKGVSKANRIGSVDLDYTDTCSWFIFIEPPAAPVAGKYHFDIMVEETND